MWNRHAHETSSAAVPNQNWLYCSIIAPKSGKRRIKLSVVNRPIVQKAMIVTKSGFEIAASNLYHAFPVVLACVRVGMPRAFANGFIENSFVAASRMQTLLS